MDCNFVVLVGRLTRDPEVRTVGKDDVQVAEFSLAVNRRRGKEEEVSFVECVAWRKAAEVIGEYCQKGSELRVQGYLKQDRWEAEDGSARSKLRVVVDDFSLGSRPRDGDGDGADKEERGGRRGGARQQRQERGRGSSGGRGRTARGRGRQEEEAEVEAGGDGPIW